MKWAGYVRVSTDDKQDPGMQREAIERYSQAGGHDFVELYEDRGISGAKDLTARARPPHGGCPPAALRGRRGLALRPGSGWSDGEM